MFHRAAALLHAGVGAVLLALGLRYLLASQLMPYHLEVVGTGWGEVPPAEQTLYLGLLRGFGAGAACTGLAIVWLALHALRSQAGWAFRGLAGLSLGYTLLLLGVTRGALLPGARPIAISAVLVGMAAAASLLSLRGARAQAGAESL